MGTRVLLDHTEYLEYVPTTSWEVDLATTSFETQLDALQQIHVEKRARSYIMSCALCRQV